MEVMSSLSWTPNHVGTSHSEVREGFPSIPHFWMWKEFIGTGPTRSVVWGYEVPKILNWWKPNYFCFLLQGTAFCWAEKYVQCADFLCNNIFGNMNLLSLQKPQLPLLGSCICREEVLNPFLAWITGTGKEIHAASWWAEAAWCRAGFYVKKAYLCSFQSWGKKCVQGEDKC